MHDIIFFKTRKTKTVIKMLRTEYDIRLVTLVRRIFFIITPTLSSFTFYGSYKIRSNIPRAKIFLIFTSW